MKMLKGVLPICLIAAVTGTGQKDNSKGKKDFKGCKMQEQIMPMQQGMCPMQGPPMGKGGPKAEKPQTPPPAK